MCGIAGVYDYTGSGTPDAACLPAMLEAMIHRGPDDEGTHQERGLALGARRLSIIDVDGGHQPIANEDGSVVVVSNGEIYNFLELRERLISRGHRMRTDCDTEVIVHLYEEYGDDCVAHMRGMFAFAVWDARRRRLLVARDRIGIKPLYWTDDGRRFAFASEIKSLLECTNVSAEVNFKALAAMLTLKYVPTPMTAFENIHSLPPGHLIVCDESGLRRRQWWDLHFEAADGRSSTISAPLDLESEVSRLRQLLEGVVRSHMMSDVPYGAFLSGGVDSSTIVALMSKELGRPITTFAAGYTGLGSEVSELRYARLVAERYETDHHEVIVGAQDLVDLAEKIVWHLDEPLADDACLPNYMVARKARDHVKMVLTGEGGDELFSGYARYVAELQFGRVAPLVPMKIRATLARAARARRGETRWQLAANAFAQAGQAARLAAYTPLLMQERLRALAVGPLAAAARELDIQELMGSHLSRTAAPNTLNRMMYFDFQHWLPDYLLLRGDKTSMAASVEARVPLLDHVLAEHAASLPPSLKIHGPRRIRKYLLREVARPLLPEPILSRSKKGFPVPLGSWFRGGAREFCHDLLGVEAVTRRGLFSPPRVAQLLREHDSGIADHGSVLWGLLSVELWHRRFIDG